MMWLACCSAFAAIISAKTANTIWIFISTTVLVRHLFF